MAVYRGGRDPRRRSFDERALPRYGRFQSYAEMGYLFRQFAAADRTRRDCRICRRSKENQYEHYADTVR